MNLCFVCLLRTNKQLLSIVYQIRITRIKNNDDNNKETAAASLEYDRTTLTPFITNYKQTSKVIDRTTNNLWRKYFVLSFLTFYLDLSF